MTTSKSTKKLMKGITLVSYERTKGGINAHSEWIYERKITFKIDNVIHAGTARAGIDRNHDISGANYHCFIMYNFSDGGWRITHGNGEGTDTKWYGSLDLAKRQVARCLKGKIRSNQLCYKSKKQEKILMKNFDPFEAISPCIGCQSEDDCEDANSCQNYQNYLALSGDEEDQDIECAYAQKR